MKKAIFLDKDGTLIPDIPYNVKPELITLSCDSVEGLKQLQASGFRLIIISNQAGVARGLFKEKELEAVKMRIKELFRKKGLELDGFYYCPHHPQGVEPKFTISCDCRKPQPGMILQAALEHSVDLKKSWMLGDILNDVEAGNRAGCKTVLVDNGNETEWIRNPYRFPHYTASSINDAAAHIMSSEAERL